MLLSMNDVPANGVFFAQLVEALLLVATRRSPAPEPAASRQRAIPSKKIEGAETAVRRPPSA
jgi:hypothetical protein